MKSSVVAALISLLYLSQSVIKLLRFFSFCHFFVTDEEFLLSFNIKPSIMVKIRSLFRLLLKSISVVCIMIQYNVLMSQVFLHFFRVSASVPK